MDAKKFSRASVHALPIYDPGHDLVALRDAHAQTLVELGANENPYGPSPKAVVAAIEAMRDAHRYPDPRAGRLRAVLSKRLQCAADDLMFGNGSHEILMQCAQVFAGEIGDEVVFSQFGFAVYPLAAMAAGAKPIAVSALPAEHPTMPLGHDLEAMAAAITSRTRLLYIANPNNPTGTWFGADAFDGFMARVPEHVVVVVDEAYAEFVNDPAWRSALSSQARYPNLMVTRTFSKAHALAGLRIGFIVGQSSLIALLEKVRENFNVSAPALAAAEAALDDMSHLEAGVRANARERIQLADALRARGWWVGPSQTNFLLVRFGEASSRIESGLLQRGVVLRPVTGYGLRDYLRITVGKAQENARLIEALDAVVEAGT